jgi:hypothetical protein
MRILKNFLKGLDRFFRLSVNTFLGRAIIIFILACMFVIFVYPGLYIYDGSYHRMNRYTGQGYVKTKHCTREGIGTMYPYTCKNVWKKQNY